MSLPPPTPPAKARCWPRSSTRPTIPPCCAALAGVIYLAVDGKYAEALTGLFAALSAGLRSK